MGSRVVAGASRLARAGTALRRVAGDTDNPALNTGRIGRRPPSPMPAGWQTRPTRHRIDQRHDRVFSVRRLGKAVSRVGSLTDIDCVAAADTATTEHHL